MKEDERALLVYFLISLYSSPFNGSGFKKKFSIFASLTNYNIRHLNLKTYFLFFIYLETHFLVIRKLNRTVLSVNEGSNAPLSQLVLIHAFRQVLRHV